MIGLDNISTPNLVLVQCEHEHRPARVRSEDAPPSSYPSVHQLLSFLCEARRGHSGKFGLDKVQGALHSSAALLSVDNLEYGQTGQSFAGFWTGRAAEVAELDNVNQGGDGIQSPRHLHFDASVGRLGHAFRRLQNNSV